MTLIQQLRDAMLNKDSMALSRLFSPTGVFCDYCPIDAGKPLNHAYGVEGIEMFFRNHFIFRKFEIKNPQIISDSQMYFYAIYGGYHLRAIATISEYGENGDIQRLVVRTA